MQASEERQLEAYRQALRRLDRFAVLTDSGFGIPGTKVRFGLDALIGLIPVVGDFAGLLLSLWLYREASRLGMPGRIKRRMLGNIAIDTLGGLLPVAGDIFDVAWRANSRNVALMRSHLEAGLSPRLPRQQWWPLWLLVTGLAVAVLLFWYRHAGMPA